MDEPQVLPGQMIERPSVHGDGIERIAYGEFISHRGELASYALGWSTAKGDGAGRLTVGLGAGNEGGGSFHAVVFDHEGSYALGLVDEPFARVPEGGPNLTREQAKVHECIDFVWWVADEALARDPRGGWLLHWLLETRALVTPEVESGAEPVTFVQHGDDGIWQFIGDTAADGATGLVTHSWHLIDADPTLMDVLDLESGHSAWRQAQGLQWDRGSTEPD